MTSEYTLFLPPTCPTKQDHLSLSAILPNGDQLDDFVDWIRRDQSGGAVRADWRPTRLRFGEVLWANGRARLELSIGSERPFVPTFFSEKPPLHGRRKKLFPQNQRELAIATAWRLVEDGQSVLIYCPERKSINPYAKDIVDLASRGVIHSVLDGDEAMLADALTIGREWLGNDNAILQCLRLGVAIHHGALPTPFRREMERLLRDGVLKITVSSPTLAQGVNLPATSIVMHAIEHYRNGKWRMIEASDFRNVIGRAGRAFVDVEGLVLFPIFDRHARSRRKWNELINNTAGQELESGLLQLVVFLLQRLHKALGQPEIDELTTYVLNNTAAWNFPAIEGEKETDRKQAVLQWSHYLAVLDTALLSLAGEEEISVEQLSERLDELLASSLWQRRIVRRQESSRALLLAALEGRAKVIWTQSSHSQRKGYFLAGVGLASGQALDALASELNPLLIEANGSILSGDNDRAVGAILNMAERLFDFEPFRPKPLPESWRSVLGLWLNGAAIAGSGVDADDEVLRFIENGLVYKLPWAMDAVRVRAQANKDPIEADDMELTIEDFVTELVVPCIETGTLNTCAARLIQAGFTSRIAAIKAVNDTDADFDNASQLKAWLDSAHVQLLSLDENWPTPESHGLWRTFLDQYAPAEESVWSVQTGDYPVTWYGRENPQEGAIVRLRFSDDGEGFVLSPAFQEVGRLDIHLGHRPKGLFEARATEDGSVSYTYRGPKDI